MPRVEGDRAGRCLAWRSRCRPIPTTIRVITAPCSASSSAAAGSACCSPFSASVSHRPCCSSTRRSSCSRSIWDTVTSSAIDVDHAKHLAVVFIELTDAFLLGTVLYIIALGLYQLFIDSSLPLPGWLRVNTIDQLKSKLVGVIVVLARRVVSWRRSSKAAPAAGCSISASPRRS